MPTVVTASASVVDRETLLWQSVLITALADATKHFHPSESPKTTKNRAEALRWFHFETSNSRADFEEVCDGAALDSDFFRTQALKILNSGVEISQRDYLWTILRRTYDW